MRVLLRMLGVLSIVGAPLAQDTPFTELRRWHWRAPTVLCAANDAAGTAVGYAVDAGPGDWQLVLYDPVQRRETARWPLPRRPLDLRWQAPGVVDVRLRDSERLLAWSHWHQVRVDDGSEVGEPVNHRLADQDPVAHRRMKPGEGGDGGEPHVHRDAAGGLAWSQPGNSHTITDASVRGLALTPDGRYAVLWLPSRLVVVPADGGDVKQLPLRADQVRAIVGGADGDEVLVVGSELVHLFRSSTATAVRSVACATAGTVDAALQPGGRLLALARGGDVDAVLVDVDSGAATPVEQRAAVVAWSPDGQVVVCAGPFRVGCYDARGDLRWDDGAGSPRSHHPKSILMRRDWNLLVCDDQTAASCVDSWSYEVLHDIHDSRPARVVSHRLRTVLAADLLVATRASHLLCCDAATWQPTADVDLGTRIGVVAVAPMHRRIAAIVGDEVVVFDVRRAPGSPR